MLFQHLDYAVLIDIIPYYSTLVSTKLVTVSTVGGAQLTTQTALTSPRGITSTL